MRNLTAKLHENHWLGFEARATAAYQAPSRAIAGDLAEGLVRDYESKLPRAVTCFMDDFEACIARAIKITDFESRQMAALIQEMDHELEAQTGLTNPTSKGASNNQTSSRFPT